MDKDEAKAEWAALRLQLWDYKQAGLTTDEAIAKVLDGELHPNMKLLMWIGAVIVLSSVCCESGFSTMAIIKTKARNRLSVEMLDVLMQIALNAPRLSDADYEQFIEETYQHWMRGVKRNPNRSHPGVSRARCREVHKTGHSTHGSDRRRAP